MLNIASDDNQCGFLGRGESCSVNEGSSKDEGVLFVKANLFRELGKPLQF